MTTAVRRFDLLVFDWDGTLFDSTAVVARSIQAACVDTGMPVPSDERANFVIGMGLVDALRYAVPDLPHDRYAEFATAYRHHYFAAQHEVVFFRGTREMLLALRERGHLLAVATGKSRRGLDDALNGSDLHGLFDATRTADQTAPKPDPRMLHELMLDLQVEPGRTLMIGDTTHDLQLAANAGTAAVGVRYGAHDVELLRQWPSLHLAEDTADLHAWLLQHG